MNQTQTSNQSTFTHIVLFRLHDSSPEKMAEVRDRIMEIDGHIPTLLSLEVGADVVRAGRSFDVGLIARFADQAGHDAYQVHPVHQELVAYMHQVASEAAAVDYVG